MKKIVPIAALTLVLLALSVLAIHAQQGQATGMTSMGVICYNLTTGHEVRGTLPATGRFDCQALGLTVNPGDTVRVSVGGTGNDLLITLFVPGIDPVEYVQCWNRFTNDEFIRRGSADTSTDCKPLPVEPGKKLSVALRGVYNPPPAVCRGFDAVRIDHLIGLLESFSPGGVTGPQCVVQPDYAELVDRDSTNAAGAELFFIANGRGVSRSTVVFIDPFRRALVQDVLQITPAEFEACRNFIVQRCTQQ